MNIKNKETFTRHLVQTHNDVEKLKNRSSFLFFEFRLEDGIKNMFTSQLTFGKAAPPKEEGGKGCTRTPHMEKEKAATEKGEGKKQEKRMKRVQKGLKRNEKS